MNEIKGRIAHILYAQYADQGDTFYVSEWDDDVSEILRAMHTPTVDMIDAGIRACENVYHNEVKNIFGAMIDAALADKVTK